MKFYAIYNSFSSSLDFVSLTDLYLPIIGTDAYALYIYLYQTNNSSKKLVNLKLKIPDLYSQVKLTKESFKASCCMLEKVGLLDTYYKTSDAGDSCNFLLHQPLSFVEFTQASGLKGALASGIGEDVYEMLSYKHAGSDFSFLGTNVSKPLLSGEDSYDAFNFDKMIRDVMLSQKKNLLISNSIKKIVCFYTKKYNILFNDMQNLILRAVYKKDGLYYVDECVLTNYLKQKFDTVIDKIPSFSLNTSIKRDKNLFFQYNCYSDLKDEVFADYKLYNAFEYLSIINKRHLVKAESNFISKLRNDMNLLDEMINMIIDYSLIKCAGYFRTKYIDKVVQTVLKLNISCLDELLDHFKIAAGISSSEDSGLLIDDNYEKVGEGL